MTERKRRKWDVAAPQGIPLTPGSGTTFTPGIIATTNNITGLADTGTLDVKPKSEQPKPGQLDADTIIRAKEGAAAIVAKLNQVSSFSVLSGYLNACLEVGSGILRCTAPLHDLSPAATKQQDHLVSIVHCVSAGACSPGKAARCA